MPRLTVEVTRLLEVVLERTGRADTAIRVERSERGFSLQIDREQEGDEVVERDGQVLLVMAEEVADKLGAAPMLETGTLAPSAGAAGEPAAPGEASARVPSRRS